MAMTEEEIASVAARRSAARRKRVTGRCEVCGTEFEGLATRRYCSDRCRVQASRLRSEANGRADDAEGAGPKTPPYTSRLTDEEFERLLASDDDDVFDRFTELVYGDYVFDTDVVEDLRRADEELSARYSTPPDR